MLTQFIQQLRVPLRYLGMNGMTTQEALGRITLPAAFRVQESKNTAWGTLMIVLRLEYWDAARGLWCELDIRNYQHTAGSMQEARRRAALGGLAQVAQAFLDTHPDYARSFIKAAAFEKTPATPASSTGSAPRVFHFASAPHFRNFQSA